MLKTIKTTGISAMLVLAAACSGAPGEEEESSVEQAATTYLLYLRCNATSWQLNSQSQLQPTADPYLFSLDFEVRQPWMVSDRDTCWVTDNTNNQYKDYGAQTAGVVQVPTTGTVWSRMGTAGGQLQFKYPALGSYRATVNWRDGYIGIHPLKSQSYLHMRVRFSDDPVGFTPQSDASTNAEVDGDRQNFARWSAMEVAIRTGVTPTISLANPRAYYLTGECNPNVTPGWYTLMDHALAGAAALGFNPSDYNAHSVRFKGEPLCGSTSWGGGGNAWLLWDGVTFHEWAHNLGLGDNESTLRSTSAQILGTALEYEGDNVYTALHNPDVNAVYTVTNLRKMGILGDACLSRPTATGTYRIYTHQVGALAFNPSQKYALELLDGTRALSFEYHHLAPPNVDPGTTNGLIMIESTSGNVIDATPRSKSTAEDDRLDAALVVGKSVSSLDGRWTVKPKARGGSGEYSYMDVDVTFR